MAHAPQLKIYSPAGEYVAACKYAEDAACLVAFLGVGATIRIGHAKRYIVWTEGCETQPASESYDHVVETVANRGVRAAHGG